MLQERQSISKSSIKYFDYYKGRSLALQSQVQPSSETKVTFIFMYYYNISLIAAHISEKKKSPQLRGKMVQQSTPQILGTALLSDLLNNIHRSCLQNLM